MAYWMLFATGELWRRAIEAEAGERIRAVQAELGGMLSPIWLGYRLQLDHVRIEWRGGLFGYRTRIKRAVGTTSFEQLLSLEQILALFPEQEGPAGEPTRPSTESHQ